MTEYDYSPEAYERHIRKMEGISRWVERTERCREEFSDPALLVYPDDPDDAPPSSSQFSSRRRVLRKPPPPSLYIPPYDSDSSGLGGHPFFGAQSLFVHAPALPLPSPPPPNREQTSSSSVTPSHLFSSPALSSTSATSYNSFIYAEGPNCPGPSPFHANFNSYRSPMPSPIYSAPPGGMPQPYGMPGYSFPYPRSGLLTPQPPPARNARRHMRHRSRSQHRPSNSVGYALPGYVYQPPLLSPLTHYPGSNATGSNFMMLPPHNVKHTSPYLYV